MIRLDYTRDTVVAVCDLCPWRELTADRADAWHAGARHEHLEHPHEHQAAKVVSALRIVPTQRTPVP